MSLPVTFHIISAKYSSASGVGRLATMLYVSTIQMHKLMTNKTHSFGLLLNRLDLNTAHQETVDADLLGDNGKPIEEAPPDDEQIVVIASNKGGQNPVLKSSRNDGESGEEDKGRRGRFVYFRHIEILKSSMQIYNSLVFKSEHGVIHYSLVDH